MAVEKKIETTDRNTRPILPFSIINSDNRIPISIPVQSFRRVYRSVNFFIAPSRCSIHNVGRILMGIGCACYACHCHRPLIGPLKRAERGEHASSCHFDPPRKRNPFLPSVFSSKRINVAPLPFSAANTKEKSDTSLEPPPYGSRR